MPRGKTKKPDTWISDQEYTKKITKDDATCPICQEIFSAPILLICKHRICEDCLMGIVDHANIECPFCRKRLNSWVRTNKIGKLGCKQFIDTKFMDKVLELKEEMRLKGEDLDSSQDSFLPIKNLSMPGEVGDEYRREQAKLDESRKEEEDKEAEESRKFIEEMLKGEEDTVRLEREHREQEIKKQEEKDRQYALELSKMLNPEVKTGEDCPSLSTRSKRKIKTNDKITVEKSKSKNGSAVKSKKTLSKNVSAITPQQNCTSTCGILTEISSKNTSKISSEDMLGLNRKLKDDMFKPVELHSKSTESKVHYDKENISSSADEDNNNNNNSSLSKSMKRKDEKKLSEKFRKKVRLGE